MNDLINAKLVFDGRDVIIPSEMGAPRDDQMQGTPAERLSEIAGRVCYDSLGKGRPSFSQKEVEPSPFNSEKVCHEVQGYHDHIKQVGHGSVWEHFNFTVGVNRRDDSGKEGLFDEHLFAFLCMNRPGLVMFPSAGGIRLTMNLRSLVEWEKFTDELYLKTGSGNSSYKVPDSLFRSAITTAAFPLAPHILTECKNESIWESRLIDPGSDCLNDHERWISMYMTMSRGCSHELVRHGDFTAISQRSTRFVDESESPWIEHPLETISLTSRFNENSIIPMDSRDPVVNARIAYKDSVSDLEQWLLSRGVDKLGARKQARGAARGYLGNALITEMIFSANIAQWKRMLRQRASVFADAEIRELFCKALAELKNSQYAARFVNWELKESPDGIGSVAVEL